MTTVSQNQAYQRWDELPDNIREAMVSDANSDFIWRTCEDEHLAEEKIGSVARITGYVLAGFIHPGDFGREVKEALNLNPQIADAIAKAINERIFKPLEPDMNNVYAPPGSFSNEPAPIAFGDIKRPGAPPIPPAPISAKTPMPPAPTINMAPPVPINIPPFKPTAPPPPSFSSRSVPITPPATSAWTPKPITPAPTPSPSTMPTSSSSEAAPMMLHEEVVMKAIRPPSSSSLNISSLPKALDMKPKETVTVKPAVLELGSSTSFDKAQDKPLAASNTPRAPMPRVVHYTELRTPLSKTEPTPANNTPIGTSRTMVSETPDREVHEITASTPSASSGQASSPQAASPSLTPPSINTPTPLRASPAVPPITNRPAPPPARIEPFNSAQGKPLKMNDVRPFGALSPLNEARGGQGAPLPPLVPPRPTPPVVSRIEPPPINRPGIQPPIIRRDFISPPTSVPPPPVAPSGGSGRPPAPPPPLVGGPLRPPTPPGLKS